MPVSSQFEQWALGYSGCDGGDIGSAGARSVWVCGIEWGGGHTPEALREQIGEIVDIPRGGYDDWKENISYIFNWQAMKLLTVINGFELSTYKQFASDTKPFVQGASGYFKMNLYPIAFRNTSREHWLRDFAEITGFSTKDEYVAWCNERRLPKISEWASAHAPKMIICLGKTFRNQFGSAFLVGQDDWRTELIDGLELSWAINSGGALVFVLPFMVNRNGLVRNSSIKKFGEMMSQIQRGSDGRSSA